MIALHLQLSLLFVASGLIFVIVRAVRQGSIQLKYSLLWLGIGFGILVFSVFPELALFLSEFLGIELPVNALFFMAIILIFLLIFQLVVILSKTEERQRRLGQKVAILELELKQFKQNEGHGKRNHE